MSVCSAPAEEVWNPTSSVFARAEKAIASHALHGAQGLNRCERGANAAPGTWSASIGHGDISRRLLWTLPRPYRLGVLVTSAPHAGCCRSSCPHPSLREGRATIGSSCPARRSGASAADRAWRPVSHDMGLNRASPGHGGSPFQEGSVQSGRDGLSGPSRHWSRRGRSAWLTTPSSFRSAFGQAVGPGVAPESPRHACMIP